MSAQLTFWYKRREKVKDLIMECEDCINLYDVVRGWWIDDTTFMLQMNDAHEESRVPDMHPKVKEEMERQKKVIPKERQWVLSYIQLHGIDVFRYRTATELMIPTKLEDLSRVQYPVALNPPKMEVKVEKTDATTGEPTGTPLSIVRDQVDPSEELPSVLPKEDIGEPIDPPAHMKEEESEIELVD